MISDEAEEAGSDEGSDEEEDESEEEQDIDDELAVPKFEQEFVDRLNKYVEKCLADDSNEIISNKTTLATQEIRNVEKLFLSSIPPGSCANCRGQGPKFRKEGMYKIFQKGIFFSFFNLH